MIESTIIILQWSKLMNSFYNDGIGVSIRNNQALAEIIEDIINRAEQDGKGNALSGKNYQSIYRTLIASLKTLIALLKINSRPNNINNNQGQQNKPQNQQAQQTKQLPPQPQQDDGSSQTAS